MHTFSVAGRARYTPSGSVDWIRFTPWLMLVLVASALGAGLLYLLLTWGLYFIIAVPVIVGLGIAVLVKFAVAQGHCRSRLTGAVAGLACGVVLYLGYYYVGMVDAIGWEGAEQLGALPQYIYFRLATDTSRDAHSPERDPQEGERVQPRRGKFYLNLFAFAFEFVAIVALTTRSGFHHSRKPYCEGCKRWLERELTTFEADKAPALVEALNDGSASRLAALCLSTPYPSLPNATLAVIFCPSLKEGGLRGCPVYTSVKSIEANARGATLDPFENAKGRVHLHATQLNDDEVLALLPRFPMFQATSGKTVAAALQQLRVAVPLPPVTPAIVASITPVEPEHAGRVLTRKMKYILAAFVLPAFLLLFGGLGLMAWGGATAFPSKKAVPREVPGRERAVAVIIFTAGGMLFLGALGLVILDPSRFSNRYLKKVLEREVASRSSRLVDLDDPEAFFVEVVPKSNWGKVQLESAADVGLLRVDSQTHEILFEGDRERYRIPAAAIISCHLEFFVEGEGTHGATKLFYVVLRAQHPSGFWEAPLRERGDLGLFKTGKRKKKAMALQAAIYAVQASAT